MSLFPAGAFSFDASFLFRFSISATFFCSLGYKCPYVFRVILISLCPMRSLMTIGATPWCARYAHAECLKSCTLILFTPDFWICLTILCCTASHTMGKSLSLSGNSYSLSQYALISCVKNSGISIVLTDCSVLGVVINFKYEFIFVGHHQKWFSL